MSGKSSIMVTGLVALGTACLLADDASACPRPFRCSFKPWPAVHVAAVPRVSFARRALAARMRAPAPSAPPVNAAFTCGVVSFQIAKWPGPDGRACAPPNAYLR